MRLAVTALVLLGSCSRSAGWWEPPEPVAESTQATLACGPGHVLAAHFYDVGQGLAVLLDLPDGRHVLVDTGDGARREGCGEVCVHAHAHLLAMLDRDLHGKPIDMLWITHQHSDHIGGAPDVLERFPVRTYVDNGRDARKAEVRRAREAAAARGADVTVVDPDATSVPLPSSPAVRLRAVVPPAWPRGCSDDANECSIGLRIEACGASILLTGDAEHEEEHQLDPLGAVTLLQVAHHGSETSTTPEFLSATRPKYAVLSAGKPDEGLNRTFCHPRALVVERLSYALGGTPSGTLSAFDGARCDRATPSDWSQVATSDRLWATERDGDVVLTTTGDQVFRRVPQ